MFILDTLLIGSLRFVLENVAAAVDAELQDDAALRERLLEAQMRLELGEISNDEYRRIEQDVLARLREIKEQHGGIAMSPHDKVTGVDIESFD